MPERLWKGDPPLHRQHPIRERMSRAIPFGVPVQVGLPDDLVLEIEAEIARSHTLPTQKGRQSVPLPERVRQSGLNPVTLKKLQALYD